VIRSLQYENIITSDDLIFSGKVIVTFQQASTAKFLVRKFKMNGPQHLLYKLRNKKCLQGLVSKHLAPFAFTAGRADKPPGHLVANPSVLGREDLALTNSSYIRLKECQQPSEIIWQNIGAQKQKTRFRVFSFVVLLLLELLIFLFLLAIKKKIKFRQNHSSQQLERTYLSLLAATLVAVFNTLLGFVIRLFIRNETHNKYSTYEVAVGKWLSLMFFTNMVLTTLLSNVFYYLMFKQSDIKFDLKGLIYDFFFLFITNSYMSSIFNIFDLLWVLKLLKRCYLRLTIKQSTYLQYQANNLAEGHPIDLSLRYANVVKTLLFTAAISPFLPIGVFFSLIGLTIMYWVDKYLLLHRYTCKFYVSRRQSKSMMNLLFIYEVMFSLGNLLIVVLPVHKPEDITYIIQWSKFYKSSFFSLYLITTLCICAILILAIKIRWLEHIFTRLFFSQNY